MSENYLKMLSDTIKTITGFDYIVLNIIMPLIVLSGVFVLDRTYFENIDFFYVFLICFGLSYTALGAVIIPVSTIFIISIFVDVIKFAIKAILYFCIFFMSTSIGISIFLSDFLDFTHLHIWFYVYFSQLIILYITVFFFRNKLKKVFVIVLQNQLAKRNSKPV